MSTLENKAKISLGSAALLALVFLPQVYKFTNKYLPVNTYNEATGCPTHAGRLLHILVFALLTYLTMGKANVDPMIKLKHTVYGALIAYFITSPAMYSFVGSILGPVVASPNGCPTLVGGILHALVYAAALTGVMYFPDRSQ